MKKLLIVLVLAGMLISAGGCGWDEPVNDTPEWITPDEKGWIWKIGYVPAKAVHEFCSGIWNGLWGDEPEEQK
jgi:hypothetical protein